MFPFFESHKGLPPKNTTLPQAHSRTVHRPLEHHVIAFAHLRATALYFVVLDATVARAVAARRLPTRSALLVLLSSPANTRLPMMQYTSSILPTLAELCVDTVVLYHPPSACIVASRCGCDSSFPLERRYHIISAPLGSLKDGLNENNGGRACGRRPRPSLRNARTASARLGCLCSRDL